MARDWINTPASDLGPAQLAAAARDVAVRHRASCREWVGGELCSGELSRDSRGRARERECAAADRYPLVAAAGRCHAASDSDRQGRLFRQRRPRHQAERRHGADEEGHGRRGGRARARAHADERAHPRAAARVDPGGGKLHQRQCLSARATCSRRARASVSKSATPTRKGVWCCATRWRLADAERPDLIIDFATLTGAARVALGPELPALFGTDDAHGGGARAHCAAEHDPLWPMPLWMGYDDELGSKIADLNNVAASGLRRGYFRRPVSQALRHRDGVLDAHRFVRVELQGAPRPWRRRGGAGGARSVLLPDRALRDV